MHGPLHITVPVAQNTGKGKNTISVTSGSSLPGEAASCAGAGEGQKGLQQRDPELSFRGRLQKSTPKPPPSILLTPLS